jgi:hypothetical protein
MGLHRQQHHSIVHTEQHSRLLKLDCPHPALLVLLDS